GHCLMTLIGPRIPHHAVDIDELPLVTLAVELELEYPPGNHGLLVDAQPRVGKAAKDTSPSPTDELANALSIADSGGIDLGIALIAMIVSVHDDIGASRI